MNVQQFLLALRGRLWVFLSLFVGTVAAAIVVTLLMPRTYTAAVAMLVDDHDAQSLTTSNQPARAEVGYMQTQVDVIQSERVARKVVEDLKLADSPGAREAFAKSGGHGSIEDWLASALLTSLRVDTSRSSVIQIMYSASDPKFAAKIANAFAQAYMEVTLRLRVDPTKKAAAWFDEQLKGLRKDFETAQERLARFQREHGIIANDERVDVENARLAELSTQALQAQNMTYDASSKLRQARAVTSAESLPEVQANPLIQTLKGQLLTAEAKLQELSTRLGPNHPQYRQQKSEIDALRARLNAEMRKVVSSVESAARQNQMHAADLQEALAKQRAKVIALRDARDQSLVLMRDVDTAQKAYEAALQRYLVNKVESGAQSTNVTILNPAAEPTRPAKPKVPLNIALGVIVGLVLGLGAVFLLELMDRRVRSETDLEGTLEAPLLGALKPWEPSRLIGGAEPPRALPGPA
ncbi:MAG TPA: chain length determinant protein EpsF [Usitatibacter sp.]|jgi:chain length determinant protein EpsF|nr:chain length determinant protein EpsF [Usitatibacter sp.]